MDTIKFIWILCGILLIAQVAYADSGCSAKAYQSACSQCSFDANNKMDQNCLQQQKSGALACVSTTYPIMSASYAKGECSAVDDCAAELASCVAQYSTGDDKADCQEGSVAICYSAADACTKSAAKKCGEIENFCAAPGLILGVVGLVVLFGYARRY